MSEQDFIVLIAAIASTLWILGIPYLKDNVSSCYKDKRSGIFLLIFWGLSIATLVGGYAYQIIKYHIEIGG